jgi:hypothetical protein
MAPRSKKIRSFSPYQYNIQYAKPGRGPVQVAKPYVKTASVTENEYVVTKLAPKFFTFLENSFYYTINDDCETQFNKLVSTFRIRNDRLLMEYENADIIENKIYAKLVEVTKKSGIQYYWKNKNTICINHNMNSIVDSIALLNDSEYLKFNQTMNSENSIDIQFLQEFKDSDKINVILYQLTNNFNTIDNIITTKIFQYDEIIDDDLKNILALENKFGNSNLFPIIFDSSNKSYILNNYDLSPSYIAFDKNEIISLDNLEDEKEVKTLNANLIKKNNPNVPDDILYKENYEYKNLIDSIEQITNKIEKLKKLNHNYDISKIIIYYINERYVRHNIFQNLDSSYVKWSSSNIVDVKHNLDGNIILILDGVKFYNYTLYKVDSNNISIKFLDEIPESFSLRIYKVN